MKNPFKRLLQWIKNLTIFFLFEISQQILLLEASKADVYQEEAYWPLVNQPASHGPFWPKLWMPLATIFVEIFQKEKKWWGSGPIGVTSWKDFSISLKKWRFEIFRTSKESTLTTSMVYEMMDFKSFYFKQLKHCIIIDIVWICLKINTIIS